MELASEKKRKKDNRPKKNYKPKGGSVTAKRGSNLPQRSEADWALINEAKKVQASKRFSQNFLIDAGVISAISRCLELKATDTVLEIGPGLGFLTQALVQEAGQVTAVELDKRLVEYLDTKFTGQDKLTLISQDFMTYALSDVKVDKFKVVGNLPYNLTSPILLKLVGELDDETPLPLGQIEQITVMVQKEVAERMTAQPGGKTYGPLSIALQYRYEVEPEFIVPSKSFMPAPKVTSAVVSLFPRKKPLVELSSPKHFRKLVRSAFSQRRKMLHNTLTHGLGLSMETVQQAFHQVGLDSKLRAEKLTMQQLAALSNALVSN